MSLNNKYKGYSLRKRIFLGFLAICLLSILGSSIVSYIILRNNAIEQSKTEQQRKSDALLSSLDYAVSQEKIKTEDLSTVLANEIYEIADISKADVIIYDLQGQYIVSNKDYNLVSQTKIPSNIVDEVLSKDKRVDIETYDEKLHANVISSYMILKNNILQPIGIIYFPHYHSDTSYLDVFHQYVKKLIFVNLLVIIVAIWLSWLISKHLIKTITKFSELINKLTLFDKDLKPIRYYINDELSSLVKSYNKMILQIQEQKERLSFTEKEQAWREMAKQVAHEVKNPLTPMKLTIQNFKRKFDPNDPNIKERVAQMSESMVEQIDLIATVASAFSQFAQLPEKENEIFILNKEIAQIVRIFNDENIFVHSNREDIMLSMDKIYLNRIITNLLTNAKQAKSTDRESIINVDLEQIQKRVIISVEDNGVGIPGDMYEKIFEPSFTSKNSGMGLGLTMVKKMVEDYNGEINVKSELGKNTKFTITLPTNL